MERIQIIFFDIDGTLISKQTPNLNDELVQALQKLREKGVKLCIATGRHTTEIADLKINEKFQFDAYITLNGNDCYTKDAIIYANAIDRRDVLNSIEYVNRNNLPCMYMEKDMVYINFVDENVKKAQESIYSALPPVMDIARAAEHDIYQIIPYFGKEQVAEMLADMPHCKATSWHPAAYDIVKSDGGKHRGIEKVLEYYSIPQSAAMAFGDGENDIEMLDFAAHAVVMGNAADSVKEHGDFVTKSVDEQGILYALRHYDLI